MAHQLSVEKALGQVQQLAKPRGRQPETRAKWRWGQIPEDLCDDEHDGLELIDAELDTLERLNTALPSDQRFEYMDEKEIDAATWRFVCLASLKPDEDHIDQFISDHARSPQELTCYFPVELLKVPVEMEVHGVKFISAERAKLPERWWGPDPRPTMESVVAVACKGTSYERMMLRAREGC